MSNNIRCAKTVTRRNMKKHVKNYMKEHGFGEQDVIPCEACNGVAVDIHHIEYKSQGGTDDAENLIALCRMCHSFIHLAGKG